MKKLEKNAVRPKTRRLILDQEVVRGLPVAQGVHLEEMTAAEIAIEMWIETLEREVGLPIFQMMVVPMIFLM